MATTTTNSRTTYVPIATTTLASTASSITLSSIPSTYTDLRIVLGNYTATTSTTSVNITFNGDTGTNYSYRYADITGGGTQTNSIGTGSSQNSTSILIGGGGGGNVTPYIATAIIEVFGYTNTSNKIALVYGSNSKNGTGDASPLCGLYRSSSAISSVTFNCGTSFSIGTTATIFGILAA